MTNHIAMQQGRRYKIWWKRPQQKQLRADVMDFMGKGRMPGELDFNARPLGGTQSLPESWIHGWMEVDKATPITMNRLATDSPPHGFVEPLRPEDAGVARFEGDPAGRRDMHQITLEDGRRVRVRVQPDGSVRLRIDGAPYAVSEMYLNNAEGIANILLTQVKEGA